GEDLAHLTPNERRAKRRLIRDLVLHWVRLQWAHDHHTPVFHFVFADLDDGAEADLGRIRVRRHNLQRRDDDLERLDAAFQKTLLAFSLVVFEVLFEIPEAFGGLDVFRYFDALMLELFQLVSRLLRPADGGVV